MTMRYPLGTWQETGYDIQTEYIEIGINRPGLSIILNYNFILSLKAKFLLSKTFISAFMFRKKYYTRIWMTDTPRKAHAPSRDGKELGVALVYFNTKF